ncbi:MAG: sensor histidine kinase, partial [Capsulimonadaceae bacterium]
DYVGDLTSWTDLMVRLIDDTNFLGHRDDPVALSPQRISLVGDVIAPAVRNVNLLARARNFDPKRIIYHYMIPPERYYALGSFPPLFLDQNRMQQVVFNLLSNSIKFAFPAAEMFHIEIDGRHNSGFYEIVFRDAGPGMDKRDIPYIFDEGYRGRGNPELAAKGEGIGLWIVRRIVEAHGGKVEVTQSYPTEITVFIPDRLASAPPEPYKNKDTAAER